MAIVFRALFLCTAVWHCLTESLSSLTLNEHHRYSPRDAADKTVLPAPVFRPGSGAGARHDPLPLNEPNTAVGNDRPIRPNSPTAVGTIVRSDPGYRRPLLLRIDVGNIQRITAVIAVTAIFAMFAMMMNNNARDTSHRIPPAYDPEHERNYSFRTYMTDVSLWLMLTDLDPPRQCAAIINRLGGAARELGRMMTPQEIAFGGLREGRQLDPVTYLLGALQARCLLRRKWSCSHDRVPRLPQEPEREH
mgnify:CR=1 FL=1